MPDKYVILTSIDSDDSKGHKNVIDRYMSNREAYGQPNICRNNHEIGKIHIPENDVTLFWINMDKMYFFDVQDGND